MRHSPLVPGETAPTGALRAIIAYKSLKAAVQLAAALVLVIWWPLGLPRAVLELSQWLSQQATHAWAARLGQLLLGGSVDRRILLSVVALCCDGALSVLEAWSLRRGHWWGPWLVVVATSLLLPFEVLELVRAASVARALLLALNLLIVGVLARRAGRERSSNA